MKKENGVSLLALIITIIVIIIIASISLSSSISSVETAKLAKLASDIAELNKAVSISHTNKYGQLVMENPGKPIPSNSQIYNWIASDNLTTPIEDVTITENNNNLKMELPVYDGNVWKINVNDGSVYLDPGITIGGVTYADLEDLSDTKPSIDSISEEREIMLFDDPIYVQVAATGITDKKGIQNVKWYIKLNDGEYDTGVETIIDGNNKSTNTFRISENGIYTVKIEVTNTRGQVASKTTKIIAGQHVHGYPENWVSLTEDEHARACACGRLQKEAHDYVMTENIDPTCTIDGVKKYVCKICNHEKSIPILALGHIGGTHENGGKCTRCDEPYQEHTWGSWVQTTSETCTAAGTQTATCTCGEKKTQSLPAKLGHTGATHANGGKCTRCNTVYVTHTWRSWVQTANADCYYAGTQTATCSCGATKTQSAPAALGHNYQNSDTVYQEPTCTQEGRKYIKCTRCGSTNGSYVYRVAYGHDYQRFSGGGNIYQRCTRCQKVINV